MKYGLRRLMIVMLLAAIAAAWWADHLRLAGVNGRLTKEVERLADDVERLHDEGPFDPQGVVTTVRLPRKKSP